MGNKRGMINRGSTGQGGSTPPFTRDYAGNLDADYRKTNAEAIAYLSSPRCYPGQPIFNTTTGKFTVVNADKSGYEDVGTESPITGTVETTDDTPTEIYEYVPGALKSGIIEVVTICRYDDNHEACIKTTIAFGTLDTGSISHLDTVSVLFPSSTLVNISVTSGAGGISIKVIGKPAVTMDWISKLTFVTN